MAHKHGTNLGGIRTLEDLRQRCVIDADTGCWHLRTARGRAMPVDKVHRVWSSTYGQSVSVTRLAWELKAQRTPAAHKVVSRVCTSYDCINPAHLKCWSKADEGAFLAKTGRVATASKRIANKISGQRRSRLTPELRTWLMESTQSNVEVGRCLGVAHSYVGALRAKDRWFTGALNGQ
jgi:hypothetical protein